MSQDFSVQYIRQQSETRKMHFHRTTIKKITEQLKHFQIITFFINSFSTLCNTKNNIYNIMSLLAILNEGIREILINNKLLDINLFCFN